MTAMTVYNVKNRETISDVSAAIGFTASKLTAGLMYASIQAVSGNIRFCVDGSTPSTSLGMRLTQDSSVEIWGTTAMSKFRCIDDGGTAKLEVVYMER